MYESRIYFSVLGFQIFLYECQNDNYSLKKLFFHIFNPLFLPDKQILSQRKKNNKSQ
jgi:hypothetical protein